VRRLGLLLLILLAVPSIAASGRAEPMSGPSFDSAAATSVYTAALGFIAPRALEPVTVPVLALWGLRGLTALDPDLAVIQTDKAISLLQSGRPVATLPIPQGAQPAAWAEMAARLSSAAWVSSPNLRRAGTQGVIAAFFDEMLDHLDPYSRYIAPVPASADEDRRAGEAGIGVILAARGSGIVISHAISDGPAALAGLREGDRILAVDGESTRGFSAADVKGWLSGPDDTEVRLQIQGPRGRRNLTLTRAQVPEENVFSRRLQAVLVVRITSFTARTGVRLAAALQAVNADRHPPSGIVLDLRGNRGGLVREAVTTADALLPAGLVAMTAGRDPAANRLWRSNEGELDAGLPLIVLVDGRTASAAEIVAAALADRGRGVVVGSSTLGKGLVQTITRLPGGGELVLTWSRVLAPRGWPIQGLGVLPQVCTSRGEEAAARQLAALARGVQPMASALDRARDARAPVPPAEVMAIREACPAAEGSDLDLLAAELLVAHPLAYATALLPPLAAASAAR
jgi:carboxyl-terminal processing protease